VGEEFLLTVMAFSTNKGRHAERVGPIGSLVFRINNAVNSLTEKWKTANVTITGPCTDITGEIIRKQYNAVKKAKHNLDDSVRYLKSTRHARDYLASAFVESDWVYKGRYVLSPAISGWPQTDRLRFDVDVYWPRAVAIASHLLQPIPNLEQLLMDNPKDDVLDILLVVALTAFAGNYPLVAESRDDRGVGALKLDLNRDCDDMAITVCAVFNYMRREKARGTSLASMIHRHLQTFAGAATIVCEANGKVSVPGQPDGTPTGHVCAVLCRELGPHMLRGGLIVESTRPSSPFQSALNTHMVGNQSAFTRPLYSPTDPGILSVKPLIVEQYIQLYMVHTSDTSFVCVKGGELGASLEAMLAGEATAQEIKCDVDSKYTSTFLTLSHQPCYEQMDDVCIKQGWGDLLGMHANTPAVYPCSKVATKYARMANPREAFVDALFITQFIAYCFI